MRRHDKFIDYARASEKMAAETADVAARNSDQCTACAKAAEQMAARATKAGAREALLEIAKQWHDLAERAARRRMASEPD